MGDFGEAVRALRLARGYRLREFARAIHLNPGHLSRIENGKRAPTPELAAKLDETLGAGGALTALAVPHHDGVPLDIASGTWLRGDADALAAALVADPPTPENAVELAHAWLIAEPPQVYEVRAGRRIGSGTVRKVRERVHQLRLLDDHVGGRDSYELARAEVTATAAMLRDASYNDHVGRGLLAALGELCQIAGWVASDAGKHVEAQRLYLCGVRAAHAGGDPATAANNLSSLAYQVAAVGDPKEAVTLARSAYRGAAHAPATARALLGERAAWAHARAGDDRAAERQLGAVEDLYFNRRPEDDPPWVYWFDQSEIEIMAGRVWTQLRRPLRAVPILERATDAYDPESAREVALYLTWLAEALIQAREVDRAADTATRALDLSRSVGSARLTDRVGAVRRLLVPHRRSAAVAAFEDRWRAVA